MDWRTHKQETAPPVTGQTAAPEKEDADEDKDEAGDGDDNDGGDAEVLVRFKPGTSRETIDRITAQLNDRVEDVFERIDNVHKCVRMILICADINPG